MPLVRVGTKQHTRYVLPTGSDNNDGTSFERAKQTVAGAIASLPTVSSQYHGRVILGAGQFVETATPIPIQSSVTIEGVGSDLSTTARTEIKLGNGRNTALFDYGSYTGVAHNVVFRNFTIDGNKANNTSMTDPLIKIRRGGANSCFEGITIRNAKAEGLYLYGQVVNFAMRSCCIFDCGGVAIHHQNAEGGGALVISDMQIDNCAEGILFDYSGTGGAASMNLIVIQGLKAENSNPGGMTHIIRHTPRPVANGNPTLFVINGVIGNNTGGGVSSNNAIHEDTGTGIAGRWLIQGGMVPNYGRVFGSAQTGQQSSGAILMWGTFEPRSDSYAYNPTRETQGVLEHIGAFGTPEGVLTAPVGSIASRSDGAAGTTFYVKQSGTGNTGWGAVPTKLTGSKTFDWPSIAAGARSSTTVTVTGAVLGDTAVASMSIDIQGMEISAHVSAADTVTVVLRNGTAAPIDLASGTLKAVVTKA